MLRDLRTALTGLRRRPGYALGVILTLGLGIGLNTAAFGVVSALLLQPPAVREPERLLRVFRHSPEAALSFGPVRWEDLDSIREQASSVGEAAAFTQTLVALERAGEPHLCVGELVSGNYFSLLGVKAVRGRLFDDAERAEPLAVLGHRTWRHRFGGDEAVVGTPLLVNGQPYTVIGVLPESFYGLTRGVAPEVWIPRESVGWRAEGSPWVVGRLAPGRSLADARAELDLIARRSARLDPELSESELAVFAATDVRILPQLDGALGDGAVVLMALAGVVLLLTVVNVSHLTLVRGLARRRELATRVALGGSRWALTRLLIAEALALSLAGGGLGIGLAAGLIEVAASLRAPLPVDVVLAPSLDHRVLGLTLAIAVLGALAISIAPARLAARPDLLDALGGGAAVTGARLRGRALVPLQVAFSLVLLSAAGLCLRSLRNAESLSPGFRSEDVVVATIAPGHQGYNEEDARRFFESLLLRLRARPDVVAAGLTSHLPLSYEWHEDRVVATEHPEEDALTVGSAGVGPGYFEALGIPLRVGREFEATDDSSAPAVAILNETLAMRLWPGDGAIGRHLRVGAPEVFVEVVGVVGDGKYRTLGEAPRGFLYRPLDQGGSVSGDAFVRSGTRTLAVRVSTPPEAFTGELRGLLREMAPDLAIGRLETLDDALGMVLWVPRAAASVFGSFGVLALLLAAAGIYGVLSFAVTLRGRELAIRMALGARPSDLRRLVVKQALILACAGVALGLVSSLIVTRLLAVALYGVSPTDPLTFVLVSALLVGVACLAAERPARRATRGALLLSLRSE